MADKPTKRRGEIHGLHGLSIALVVAYHQPACRFTLENPPSTPQCVQFTRELTDYLLALRPDFSCKMPECVQRYGATDARCLRPAAERLAPVSPQLALETDPNMLTVDLTEFICPAGWCSPVIGNVHVHMDDNHLSRTYAHTLQDEFEAQLWRAVGR